MFFRHPIQRFVSAFYSRRRCGRPRYHTPWNATEAAAFACFATPGELAGALSSLDSPLRAAAYAGMSGIQLLRDSLFTWIESDAYFAERAKDILFVGFQENLADDFNELKRLLDLPAQLELPADSRARHSNPPADTLLDSTAVANLEQWYARDITFFNACRARDREHEEPRLSN